MVNWSDEEKKMSIHISVDLANYFYFKQKEINISGLLNDYLTALREEKEKKSKPTKEIIEKLEKKLKKLKENTK